MVSTAEYSKLKTNALRDIKAQYYKLEQGLITYKSFKAKARSILRKYGCRYEIFDFIYYVDLNNQRYYLQSFSAGDFDVQFIIDISFVDPGEVVQKGGLIQECYVYCIADNSIDNFNNEF